MKNVCIDVFGCRALGDTLSVTPTLRKLYNSYGKKISVATNQPEIFKNNPYVDNIFNEITNIRIENQYVNNITDIESFIATSKIGVLKPTKGTASNKVIKISTENINSLLIKNIINDCKQDELVIEEFIEGDEYAYEGMLINSELSNFVVFEKPLVFVEPFFEESIYMTPSNLDEEIIDEVKDKIQMACKEIGLTNGPIHAEFKVINNEIFIYSILIWV